MLIRFLAVVGAVNREAPFAVALLIIGVLSPSRLRLGTSREAPNVFYRFFDDVRHVDIGKVGSNGVVDESCGVSKDRNVE